MDEPTTETQTCLQWIVEDDVLYVSCRRAVEALFSDDKRRSAKEIREILADQVKGRVMDRAAFRYRFRPSDFQLAILDTISRADWLEIADRIWMEVERVPLDPRTGLWMPPRY